MNPQKKTLVFVIFSTLALALGWGHVTIYA
mgnify:CR=1 FL=1